MKDVRTQKSFSFSGDKAQRICEKRRSEFGLIKLRRTKNKGDQNLRKKASDA